MNNDFILNAGKKVMTEMVLIPNGIDYHFHTNERYSDKEILSVNVDTDAYMTDKKYRSVINNLPDKLNEVLKYMSLSIPEDFLLRWDMDYSTALIKSINKANLLLKQYLKSHFNLIDEDSINDLGLDFNAHINTEDEYINFKVDGNGNEDKMESLNIDCFELRDLMYDTLSEIDYFNLYLNEEEIDFWFCN